MTITIDTIIAASVADEQQGLADKAGIEVFSSLRDYALGQPSREAFELTLETMEIKYMEMFHPEEKFKDGRWKFSKLPTRWRTAKSVISSALDHSLNINDRGKSDIEKEIKKVKTKNRTMTAKLFNSRVKSLKEAFEAMEEDERVNVASNIFNFFDSL